MTINGKRRSSQAKDIYHQSSIEMKVFVALALVLILSVNVFPTLAVAKPNNGYNEPQLQTASTLIVIAEADARVEQHNPTTNTGTSNYLATIRANNRSIESYLRFTVSGISGVIQTARLRVYDTTDATKNGPAVYATNNTWTETGITWNNRPARTSGAVDNKGAIPKNTWVEYDVSTLVTGNGTYSFVLAGDSGDSARFSSREGSQPPQLTITFNSLTNTPTVSQTSVSTSTPIPTQTSTLPSSLTPTVTRTPTTIPIQTATPTATSSSGSVVLVGAGDISTCSNNNDEATAKLLDAIPGTVFTAGDNAYDSGTYTQYLNCYDPTWGRHKSRTEPVPGNHEYATSGAAGYFQYFNNIPAYYAYNLGSWRIYALNSEIDVSATGPEATWLQSDLAANPSQCVLAYWHKARWSSGSTHGSTSSMQAIWQILYNAGAELVVSGHEHNYERFAEMNASGTAASPGLREIVIGTGGMSLYPFGTPLSTSQVRSNSSYGVLKLTLHAGSYDWQFVPVAGSTFTDSGSSNCH